MTTELSITPTELVKAAGELLGTEFKPTGSRVICPQVANEFTDYDYIGLVEKIDYAAVRMLNDEWETGTSFPADASEMLAAQFVSFKKGLANILITSDLDFYDKFLLATRVAMALGLTDKSHRILLFQAILYGNGPCSVEVPTP